MENKGNNNPIKVLFGILVLVIMIVGNIALINIGPMWREWIWIGLFIILLVIEAISMDLTTIWFALGAMAAFLISLTSIGFIPQLVAFNLVSLGLLIVARPASIQKINSDRVKTNVDAIIGQEVFVLEEINLRQNTGVVRVNGLEWTARAEDKEAIFPVNIMVKIVAVEGVKVIVRKC